MIRGFVYSFIAVVLFLAGAIFWMVNQGIAEDNSSLASGWILLVCIFAVGPGFFFLGYWHNRKLKPEQPHWDPELGE